MTTDKELLYIKLGLCLVGCVLGLFLAAITIHALTRPTDITTASLEQQLEEVEELQEQYLKAHQDYLKNQQRANEALGITSTDLDYQGTFYVSPGGWGVVLSQEDQVTIDVDGTIDFRSDAVITY